MPKHRLVSVLLFTFNLILSANYNFPFNIRNRIIESKMDRYLEMLQNMETIPEKDVRQICEKVTHPANQGQINTHGRIQHGTR